MNTLPLDWENKNISVQILFDVWGRLFFYLKTLLDQGHKNLKTTMNYIHVADERAHRAVANLPKIKRR